MALFSLVKNHGSWWQPCKSQVSWLILTNREILITTTLCQNKIFDLPYSLLLDNIWFTFFNIWCICFKKSFLYSPTSIVFPYYLVSKYFDFFFKKKIDCFERELNEIFSVLIYVKRFDIFFLFYINDFFIVLKN